VQEVVYKHQELMCPGLYQPEVLWIEQTQLHGEMTMGHALLVLWGTAHQTRKPDAMNITK
jgi:hypothetical protein